VKVKIYLQRFCFSDSYMKTQRDSCYSKTSAVVGIRQSGTEADK